MPPYTPLGTPPYPARYWSLYYTPGVLHSVSGNEALGSTSQILREYEANRALVLPKV